MSDFRIKASPRLRRNQNIYVSTTTAPAVSGSSSEFRIYAAAFISPQNPLLPFAHRFGLLRAHMDRPPTIEELVGCSRPVTGLDERYVVKHFLGKNQSEARKMFPNGGTYITEDFTYMAPGGLRYYLPPAFEYLRAEESTDDWEFCHGLMCSLYCQVRSSSPLPTDVLSLFKEISAFCDGHRQKFCLQPEEELFDKYVLGIREA